MENEEQKDLKTVLLETSMSADRKLSEAYMANSEAIDAFFKTLTEDGASAGTEVKMTVNDVANIYRTIEVLNKNVDTLQELSIMTSLQAKVLQNLLYNVASSNTLKAELKVD